MGNDKEKIGELRNQLEDLHKEISELKKSKSILRQRIGELKGELDKCKILLDNLPLEIFYKDKDGVYISCNFMHASCLRLPPHEVVGKTDYDFFPPELARKKTALDMQVIDSGKALEIEEKFIENGKEKILRKIKMPVRDDDDNLAGVMSISWDITEESRAAGVMRKSEEALRLAFENSRNAIIWADPETGVIIKCNRAAEILLERSRSEITGSRHDDIHPPGKAAHYAERFIAYTKGRGLYEGEAEVITKSGKIRPVYINTSITTVDEKLIVQETFSDFSERKWAEWTMLEGRRFAENIFNTVREPLLVLDEHMHVIVASNSFYQTFKVTPAETEDMYLFDLANRQWDIPGLRELLEDIIPRATSFDDFEVEFNIPGKGQRIMLLNGRLVHREENNSRIILLAIEDITGRKQVEEKLRIAREEFLSSLTHNMKGPLASMTGYLHLLEKSQFGEISERKREFVKMMQNSVETLLSMVNTIVYASLIEAGQMNYAFKDFPLEVLVGDLFQTFDALAYLGKVTFALDCPKGTWVLADREKIREVFCNLITNALRYTPPGGTISIEASPQENGRFAIKVRDTGTGIAESEHGKIFQKARRVKGETRGTGLGLYVVKNILQGHGSEISFESSPGKGTRFFFSLEKGTPLEAVPAK